MGGEEFIVILPNTNSTEAEKVAERLRTLLATPSGDLPHYTVSIGVATYQAIVVTRADKENNTTPQQRHNKILDTLIADADDALYQAKRSGRNRVAVKSTDSSAQADFDGETPSDHGLK